MLFLVISFIRFLLQIIKFHSIRVFKVTKYSEKLPIFGDFDHFCSKSIKNAPNFLYLQDFLGRSTIIASKINFKHILSYWEHLRKFKPKI